MLGEPWPFCIFGSRSVRETGKGLDVVQMCAQCQDGNGQWAQERAVYDTVLENLPEPCGQQFPEEPPESLSF
jgi:hypothetical protein